MEENEQIAQLQTDMSWVKKMLENHLKHHFLITLAAWGVTLSAIGALVLVILNR